MRDGFLLREDRYAFIQYGEDAKNGIELFDMHKDPGQFTNLAGMPEHSSVVGEFKVRLATKLREVRASDLAANPGRLR